MAIIHTLLTHDGKFHCDDALAYATLKLALGLTAIGHDHRLIRTRDKAKVALFVSPATKQPPRAPAIVAKRSSITATFRAKRRIRRWHLRTCFRPRRPSNISAIYLKP